MKKFRVTDLLCPLGLMDSDMCCQSRLALGIFDIFFVGLDNVTRETLTVVDLQDQGRDFDLGRLRPVQSVEAFCGPKDVYQHRHFGIWDGTDYCSFECEDHRPDIYVEQTPWAERAKLLFREMAVANKVGRIKSYRRTKRMTMKCPRGTVGKLGRRRNRLATLAGHYRVVALCVITGLDHIQAQPFQTHEEIEILPEIMSAWEYTVDPYVLRVFSDNPDEQLTAATELHEQAANLGSGQPSTNDASTSQARLPARSFEPVASSSHPESELDLDAMSTIRAFLTWTRNENQSRRPRE